MLRWQEEEQDEHEGIEGVIVKSGALLEHANTIIEVGDLISNC